jgi:hypothetical protein
LVGIREEILYPKFRVLQSSGPELYRPEDGAQPGGFTTDCWFHESLFVQKPGIGMDLISRAHTAVSHPRASKEGAMRL